MNDVGAKHPWLHQPRKPSSDVWYLRARVPKDVPNYPKSEVKRSLGTSNYREACRRIDAAAAELQREFDDYRHRGGPPPPPPRVQRVARVASNPKVTIRYQGTGSPPPDLRSSEDLTDADVRSFTAQVWHDWQSWIVAPVPSSDPHWLYEHAKLLELDRWDDYLRPLQDHTSVFRVATAIFLEKRGYYFDTTGSKAIFLSDYIFRAGSEAYRQRIERISGVTGYDKPDPLFDTIASAASHFEAPPAAPKQTSPALTKVIELYENDPRRRDIEQKTRNEDQRTFAYMKEFFGAHQPINQIDRAMCTEFCKVILSIPKNAYRDHKGSTLEELRTIAIKKGLPLLSNKGANKYIHKLSAVMNFAIDSQMISTNPAVKLAMPAKHSIDDRDPFSMETISKIFSSDAYMKAASLRYDLGDAAWFWVPLLSLFMGLRLGEACQLHVEDIVDAYGIQSIKIEENKLDGAYKKRLKTPAANRTIPCHPTLVEMGFLSFVDHLKRRERVRLFENEVRGEDGYFSPFSKRYSRFLTVLGCKTKKTSFHSFRHNCKEALDDAGVPEKTSFAIGGWTDASQNTGSRYGSRAKMLSLTEAIAKVSYRAFPLDRLKSDGG